MLSVRALLSDIVDYAGLFPPAALAMAPTVEGYAEYRALPEAWMLGRLIVPVARLEEFEAAAGEHLRHPAGGPPWRLSVLAGEDPAEDAGVIAAFQQSHGHAVRGPGARIEAVELKAADIRALKVRAAALEAGSAGQGTEPIEIFCELPDGVEPAAWVEAVASVGASAKIRTGGITAEAIPSVERVADFLRACAERGVPFKATAGLHHPLPGTYRLTYEDEPPRGAMHGFLNVFLAAALLDKHLSPGDFSQEDLLALLAESDANALSFDAAGAAWREFRLSLEEIRSSRRSRAMSFGSCSFTEPVDDLKEMRLL